MKQILSFFFSWAGAYRVEGLSWCHFMSFLHSQCVPLERDESWSLFILQHFQTPSPSHFHLVPYSWLHLALMGIQGCNMSISCVCLCTSGGL